MKGASSNPNRLWHIRQLAARFTGLMPPSYAAGKEIARKIDAELMGVADEAQRILGLTIAAEDGRQFPSRAEFAECLAFLAALSCDQAWAFLLTEADRAD